MSSFEEFMENVKRSSERGSSSSEISLPEIQTALVSKVDSLIRGSSASHEDQQQFLEDVASLVQNRDFFAEFSDQIGEPQKNESEDDFVRRGSEKMRQMLYEKFNVRILI